jgi:hypothetical protein
MKRRLQFSIATLLIVVGLVAAICGWQVHRVAEQRVRAIRIDALQVHADRWREKYQKNLELQIANAKGGEIERLYYAGAQLCLADADLAFEKGSVLPVMENPFRS